MAATTIEERIDALRKIGVPVGNDHEYRGKVGSGDRKSHDLPGTVEGVSLNFTAEEWCRMCMRDYPGGDQFSLYLGGCCGNMGVCQDVMNACFRDGGYLSADDLQTIGPLLRGHDGFEPFGGDFDVDEYLYASTFRKLDPWERVCVIHRALEDALKLPRQDKPRADSDVREGYEDGKPGNLAITKLYNTLARIEWSDLFDGGDLPGKVSHKMQRRIALARLVEPTQKLVDILEAEMGTEPFTGYALVKPGTDEVLDNRQGQLLFDEREDAQYLLDLWARWETEESARKKHGEDVHEPVFVKPDAEIVAVSVSAYGGIEVLR